MNQEGVERERGGVVGYERVAGLERDRERTEGGVK